LCLVSIDLLDLIYLEIRAHKLNGKQSMFFGIFWIQNKLREVPMGFQT